MVEHHPHLSYLQGPHTTELYTLSLHDALPIFAKSITFSGLVNNLFNKKYESNGYYYTFEDDYTNPGQISTVEGAGYYPQADRKSTRLNFSHVAISYAVFCLKKKINVITH